MPAKHEFVSASATDWLPLQAEHAWAIATAIALGVLCLTPTQKLDVLAACHESDLSLMADKASVDAIPTHPSNALNSLYNGLVKRDFAEATVL